MALCKGETLLINRRFANSRVQGLHEGQIMIRTLKAG
jgi:hypothetical protein